MSRPGPHPISRARPGLRIARRKALQFHFERADHIGRRGEKFVVFLVLAAESDVIVSVFASALVPFGAHLLDDIRVRHFLRAILSLMAIAFDKVTLAPLQAFTATAPDSAVIGIIGENGSGKRALLRVAAGQEIAAAGSVAAGKIRRYLGPGDEPDFSEADLILLENTFAGQDALGREWAATAIERCRRQGATILLVSHEEPLLRRLCDEIWWLHEGKLMGRGDPVTMLGRYGEHVSRKLRESGEGGQSAVSSRLRRGDGRAEIVQLETLGYGMEPTIVWRGGETVHVRVTVRFHQDVRDPVIGILIRNRIGLDVYGTNTELEKVMLGFRAAGETVRITFRFNCELCPQDYTLTVASHDPDGTRHDWLEEAMSISVTDSRYTAGVANLRAQVTIDNFCRSPSRAKEVLRAFVAVCYLSDRSVTAGGGGASSALAATPWVT